VPFYPVTPILLCATAALLLWSSVTYTGGVVGVAVLLTEIPVLMPARTPEKE
jgi:hypothetical protein